MANKSSVIVIGAGLSGLSAAGMINEHLLKEPHSVLVLEAKKRTGGRTYTENGVDMGAAFVGPTQTYLLEAARKYNIKKKEVPIDGKYTFSYKGKVMHSDKVYDLEEALGCLNHVAILYHLKELDRLGKDIDVKEPWNSPKAREWDEKTVETWIKESNNFPSCEGTREVARFFVRILLGVEPCEISLLYYLWYVKSGRGVKHILFGAQTWSLIGGTQQVSIKMAADLPTDAIALSHTVNTITQTDESVTVTTTDGKSFNAEYCILAVSPGVRNRITYSPPLTPEFLQLPQRMPMGTTIKTHMFYDVAFWNEKGYNGQATIPDGKIVSQVFDLSEEGRPCLMGFIVGDKGRHWLTATKHERKEAIHGEYCRIFEYEAARDPKDYVEYLGWESDPDIGGAPTGTCPPGTLTKFHAGLRKSTGRLHFAGTETATGWSGYMDGAIQAGKRAATEVLMAMGKMGSLPAEHLLVPYYPRIPDCQDVLLFFANRAKKRMEKEGTDAPLPGIETEMVSFLRERGFDDGGWLQNLVRTSGNSLGAFIQSIKNVETHAEQAKP